MRSVGGREVLEGVEETLAADRSALVAIDMQNDLRHDDGVFATDRPDVTRIQPVVRLLDVGIPPSSDVGHGAEWTLFTGGYGRLDVDGSAGPWSNRPRALGLRP